MLKFNSKLNKVNIFSFKDIQLCQKNFFHISSILNSSSSNTTNMSRIFSDGLNETTVTNPNTAVVVRSKVENSVRKT